MSTDLTRIGEKAKQPDSECLNEEPDVRKTLVRFREGLGLNWCMVEIKWHRRETRRQTENTNFDLQHWEAPAYSTNNRPRCKLPVSSDFPAGVFSDLS